jgi:hypothetical protein
MRQRKHHMKVRDWQQFVCTEFNPLLASVDLALRAMPIAARVERDGSMTALRTGINMTAQRCCTTVLDGAKHF